MKIHYSSPNLASDEFWSSSLTTMDLSSAAAKSHSAQASSPSDLAFQPMLAYPFKGKLPKGLLFSQPKLDGVRCIAMVNGLWTRTGNKIVSCSHVETALKPLFEEDPSLILDGELYAHKIRDGLSTIISLVNTRNPDSLTRQRCADLIGFHCFDMPSCAGSFSERCNALKTLFRVPDQSQTPIRLVETTELRDAAHMDAMLEAYLSEGYEGQMIRRDALYERKRSPSLLKRKPFEDAEFEVVRLLEVGGSHSGYVKRAILRLPDGRIFASGIKGSKDYARSLLARTFQWATVRYSAVSASGVPKCSAVITFHADARI